jgi:hypothetical protein
MSRLSSLIARLPAVDSRSISEVEREIRDELEFHLAMRAEENARLGMTPAAARAAAETSFGDFSGIYGVCRQALIGDRIMFQRLQTAAIAVLLMSVILLASQMYSENQANRLALAELTAQLSSLRTAGTSTPVAQPAWEADRPRAIETFPANGATDVDPATSEIRVTFDKSMADGCWSWVRSSPEEFPESVGDVHYQDDMKTCVMPVTLEPGKKYVVWFNTENYQNFKDRDGRPAVPHLLTFTTRK